jgi:hypothetical protein
MTRLRAACCVLRGVFVRACVRVGAEFGRGVRVMGWVLVEVQLMLERGGPWR